MYQPCAGALSALRDFNYERIYTRPSSLAQGRSVVAVLSALVEYFATNPEKIPVALSQPAHEHSGNGHGAQDPFRLAITYVSGMTDRFAFATAVELLGWPVSRLPPGVDAVGRSV